MIDAYDNPNAEADLAAYRAQYGLSPCTTANGCFRKVNQACKTGPLPPPDTGWGLEVSLDLQAVSAACPQCHLLLVEANSSNITDRGCRHRGRPRRRRRVQQLRQLGRVLRGADLRALLQAPRVPIVVSTGDYGYGNGRLLVNSISYPSASRYVVAAGGTSLYRRRTRRGAGASPPRPAGPAAARRTSASPAGSKTGCAATGWSPTSRPWPTPTPAWPFTTPTATAAGSCGGTSAAAPMIASVYALAGNGARQRYASGLYRHPSALFDITAGANGNNCSATYLCTAGPATTAPPAWARPTGPAASS